MNVQQQYKLQMQQQQQQQQQQKQQQAVPLAHNGQNNHMKRRNSKVPVREMPEAMPSYQHSTYPQLYTAGDPTQMSYKWDGIILDLDRTIIHGKRLSVKRWRKYVENGTIPSLAENQCSKWHRHIHRKGHQMHPFIRGRTMIYYRPFTWHLLAVLDYLKSHFGTKIIVCTKAGEHYAASVIAALISNFTSANPDLIDDVYNFHDLHDDEVEDGKPKKPFGLICNRHKLDPRRTLIVDDNATSWFGADRKLTNFWMPPCYGYQIHDIDNELQLLCKYLWDPIQANHLKKKSLSVQVKHMSLNQRQKQISDSSLSMDSSVSPSNKQREIISRQSPKSVTSSNTFSPKNLRYLTSPANSVKMSSLNNGNSVSPRSTPPAFQENVSATYSIISSSDAENTDLSSHNSVNTVSSVSDSIMSQEEHNAIMHQHKVSNLSRISRSYNKRRENGIHCVLPSNESCNGKTKISPKSVPTKTKKKGYFQFEARSRGSKKLAKLIGK